MSAAAEEIDHVSIVLPDGSRSAGEVLQREWIDRDDVEVEIRFLGRAVIGRAVDYFDALLAVRRQLDPAGILLDCYGSSIDVWPSSMSRDMGGGVKAYRTRLGQRAKTADLLSIWDTGPDVRLATVDEQERFHQDWLGSVRAPE